MKTNKLILKLLSALMAMTVVLGAFAAMPQTAHADTQTEIRDQINRFNHGGTGSLEAFIVTGRGVVVSGSVTGVTRHLDLRLGAGVNVVWSADYSGSVNGTTDGMIQVYGGGSFSVTAGAIVNSGSSPVVESLGITGLDPTTINISGGIVSNTGTGCAIYANRDVMVNVTGGTVSAISNNAIRGSNIEAPCIVNISGGFVFAGNDTAIGRYTAPTISGNAVVCGWNKPSSGTPTYTAGSSTNLTVSPLGAKATWGKSGTQNGINYSSSNGSVSGFFQVSGVTVNAATTTIPTFSATAVPTLSSTGPAFTNLPSTTISPSLSFVPTSSTTTTTTTSAPTTPTTTTSATTTPTTSASATTASTTTTSASTTPTTTASATTTTSDPPATSTSALEPPPTTSGPATTAEMPTPPTVTGNTSWPWIIAGILGGIIVGGMFVIIVKRK